jgi:hypothetical protein
VIQVPFVNGSPIKKGRLLTATACRKKPFADRTPSRTWRRLENPFADGNCLQKELFADRTPSRARRRLEKPFVDGNLHAEKSPLGNGGSTGFIRVNVGVAEISGLLTANLNRTVC